MSVLNQSGEEQVECPLCMEPLEVDDLHFYPCTCGYQICRFCWNRIREGENGLCPACRKAYPENPADFTPLSQEQVAAIKTEKKAREQKRRNKTLESRRALANVRVVQNNLVFVVGLPVRLADPEILKRQEYFGKYGKIHKVVINQSPAYAGSQVHTQSPSASAYVTYVSPADALRAIQGVNNVTLDGRVLKGSLGTTKYCANFMKNQPCPKPDCMYLHELGDPKASFTKEEMHAGLHQVYERRLHQQLLANKPEDRQLGNSSTNADKGSTKDGNQSNLIPTTVVTTSQINSVSTSKSKKDTNGSTNGTSNGSSNGNGNGNSVNGKEAWPSLGCSPPADSPARKQLSPKPHSTAKSQENGTSESSSPTLHSQQSQTKNGKENHSDKANRSNKDSNSNTNGQTKKSKSDKSKQKNSISTDSSESSSATEKTELDMHAAAFDNDTQFLTNELDELESDRHSLLENHDLLDSSDHSLLEDDTHNLLNDANNEVLMMQRHREMLAGLIDNNVMPHMKSPLVNGYGLLDRDTMSYLGNDRQISQINQGLMEQKELLMRERNRSMLLRQNELVARQHNVMVDLKHYMPSSSIGMECASELLGANYHPNPNMLPPFGMRIDNSLATNSLGNTSLAHSLSVNSLSANTLTVNSLGGNGMSANTLSANTLGSNTLGGNNLGANTLGGNTLAANSLGANNMGANSLGNSLGGNNMANALGNSPLVANSMGANTLGGNVMGSNVMANPMGGNTLGMNSMGSNAMGNTIGGFMLQNQQLQQLQNQQQQMQQVNNGLVNGFDSPQAVSEARYQADTMDKFFTDFRQAQQLRLAGGAERPRYPHNMLSAERLEMEHKRMNNFRTETIGTGAVAGTGAGAGTGTGGRAAGDGDDDLDFDPFKETQKALAEMMETEMMLNNISSGDNMERVRRTRLPPPGFSHMNAYARHQPQQQGFNNSNAVFSDWTQMDPAIMSTSVNFGKSQPSASASQQELFARFNQLSVQPNGVKLHAPPAMVQWAGAHAHQKPWGAVSYNAMPLPPGFAPPKTSQHPAECIDAK